MNSADRRQMTKAVLAATAVVVSTVLVIGQIGGGPWGALTGRTAWVILGVVDSQTHDWQSLPGYAIVHRHAVGDALTPAAGDVLSITHDLYLYILDFKTKGEMRRLDAPIDVQLKDGDSTGLVLKPGARVVVKEVRVDSGSGCETVCTVWARVAPDEP